MSIQYRLAVESDAAVIAEFQRLMAQETEDLALEPETVLRGVRAVLKKSHPDAAVGTYHVAVAPDGRIAGCTMVLPEWSDWRNGTVWWIHSVYVLPEFRKLGVFRGMYEHLRRQVVGRPELRGLRLFVDRKNSRAQSVYRKLGMNGDHYQLWEWMKG